MRVGYIITVQDGRQGRLSVNVDLADVTADTLRFRAAEHSAYMRVTAFHAYTMPEMLPLPTAEVVNSYSPAEYVDPVGLASRNIAVRGATSNVRVTYEVEPGAPIRLQGEGRYPRTVSSYLDSTFGAMAGRNLFLVPDGRIAEWQVIFQLPTDWQAFVPWAFVRQPVWRGWSADTVTVYHPQVFDYEAAEELLNAPVILGHFSSSQTQLGSQVLRVCTYARWPQAFQDTPGHGPGTGARPDS